MVVGGPVTLMQIVALVKLYQTAYVKQHERQEEACVTRIKTLPEQPNPMIKSRTIAWFEYVNNVSRNNDDCEDRRNNPIIPETSPTTPFSSLPEGESSFTETAVDLESLCVQVDPAANVQVGEHLTVTLLNGDSAQPFYLPYLRIEFKHNVWKCAQYGLIVVGAILVLHFAMPGIPVAFASSNQLETFYQSSWFCALGTEDETGDELEKDLAACCSITWTVAWAYRLVIGEILGGIVLFTIHIFWKVRNIVSGANGGSYQMLSVTSGGEENTSTNDSNDNPVT